MGENDEGFVDVFQFSTKIHKDVKVHWQHQRILAVLIARTMSPTEKKSLNDQGKNTLDSCPFVLRHIGPVVANEGRKKQLP